MISSLAIEDIRSAALSLPLENRRELAVALAESVTADDAPESEGFASLSDSAFEAEIRRRAAAAESGESRPVSRADFESAREARLARRGIASRP